MKDVRSEKEPLAVSEQYSAIAPPESVFEVMVADYGIDDEGRHVVVFMDAYSESAFMVLREMEDVSELIPKAVEILADFCGEQLEVIIVDDDAHWRQPALDALTRNYGFVFNYHLQDKHPLHGPLKRLMKEELAN